jgi:hypothetical protein
LRLESGVRFVCDGNEPIADDEILYRRIPLVWNNPELNPQAFAPNKDRDITGLSLTRAKYKSKAEAAIGQPGRKYFVAELTANDIRAKGLTLIPKPLPGDPGHCEISEMNSGTRKDTRTIDLQEELKGIAKNVQGPFP